MAEEKIQENGAEQKKKRKRNHYYRRNKRRNTEVPLSEKNSEEITEVNDIEDASFEAEDVYDQKNATGFIKLNALRLSVLANSKQHRY